MARKPKKEDVVRADGPLRIADGEIRIDTQSLPKSSRCYVAQVTRVLAQGSRVSVYFGQRVMPEKLLSIAIVELTTASFKRLQETLRPDFRESVSRFAASDDVLIQDGEIEKLSEARFFITAANIGRITMSEVGIQVDWYQLDPAEVRCLSMGMPFKRENLTAPLTVMMTGDVLATLISEMDKIEL